MASGRYKDLAKRTESDKVLRDKNLQVFDKKTWDSINKMFGFTKKIIFFTAMAFVSCNALKCVSMSNQECKIRPAIININSNEPSFYPYSIFVNKSSGSCNDINDLHAKLYVTDVVKNMNFKVFNLMSRINETRHIEWHETYKM